MYNLCTLKVLDAPYDLLEELLADHLPALLGALVHGVLHQIVGHVIVSAVDQPHHQVRGHAAERLRLRVGEGQQLGDVLLVAPLAHHEHQLEVVAVIKAQALGPALGHHLLHPLPVAGLGVAAGQGEVGLLGWKADPFVSSP